MMFAKILAAYDSSKASKKALERAIALAEANPGSELEVVYVSQYPADLILGEALISVPVNLEKDKIEEDNEEIARETLEEIQQKISGLEHAKAVKLEGSPAKQILEYAHKNGFDLIVIGSRGLGSIREWVLGSVSHSVVQHARIPVLVVK